MKYDKIENAKDFLKVGMKVRTNSSGNYEVVDIIKGIVGFIGSSGVYIFQNKHNGDKPSNFDNIKRTWKYSWFVNFNSTGFIEIIDERISKETLIEKYVILNLSNNFMGIEYDYKKAEELAKNKNEDVYIYKLVEVAKVTSQRIVQKTKQIIKKKIKK
ncbi:MAG TPA: hypothetical protein VGB37_14720 [Candidatus Lokiarchaeia archaeon]